MRASEGRRSGWLVAALGLGFFGACSLETEPPSSGPCLANPSICDDGNPCTINVCAPDGYCDHIPSGELVPDDGNPCTEDKCVDGVAQSTPLPDNTPCGLNDQLSCAGGKCACTTAAECGLDTECQTFACTTDGCRSTNLPEGTYIDGASEADCKQRVCDGAGKIATVVDMADAGPDPAPGDCRMSACDMTGKIVDVPAVMDFPADMVAGDCQRKGCSMNGQVEDLAADDDAPADDGNPCTAEGCNNGTLINHEPTNEGVLCGAAATCVPAGSAFSQTSAEVCTNGTCTLAATTSCGLYKCNGAACHTACSDSTQCISGTFCSNGTCAPQAGLGNPCTMPAQCANSNCVDGFCCNTTCSGLCEQCDLPGMLGVCSPVPMGADPDNECSGTEVCGGSGQCKKLTGETCSNDDQCITGQCEDGYCCNTDCPGDCRTCNQTGFFGTCKDVPFGQPSGACQNTNLCNGFGSCKKINGQGCGGNSECMSGFCPNEVGGSDVCCESACTNNCKSCIGSRTVGGVSGVCDFVKDKTDPNDDCGGSCNMGSGMGCCMSDGTCY